MVEGGSFSSWVLSFAVVEEFIGECNGFFGGTHLFEAELGSKTA